MKPVRNNRYRRKRRRSDRTKLLILLSIVGGGVLVAAGIVTLIVLLLVKGGGDGAESPAPVIEEESSAVESALVAEPPVNPNVSTAETSGYQALYPDLYVPLVEKIPAKAGEKMVYLTFDNGPSSQTEPLLKALEQAGIKATFFVSAHGAESKDLTEQLQKIAQAGHAIGIYAYDDNRQQLYQSVKSYLEDFAHMSDLIYQATGEMPTMVRLPGGSRNAENEAIYKELTDELTRRGYTYFDWNVDSGDSLSAATGQMIADTTVEGITTHGKSIVLLHNTAGNQNTTQQIGTIVSEAKAEGYIFAPLTPSVKPFSFANPE